jgi:hypothetical protein
MGHRCIVSCRGVLVAGAAVQRCKREAGCGGCGGGGGEWEEDDVRYLGDAERWMQRCRGSRISAGWNRTCVARFRMRVQASNDSVHN